MTKIIKEKIQIRQYGPSFWKGYSYSDEHQVWAWIAYADSVHSKEDCLVRIKFALGMDVDYTVVTELSINK